VQVVVKNVVKHSGYLKWGEFFIYLAKHESSWRYLDNKQHSLSACRILTVSSTTLTFTSTTLTVTSTTLPVTYTTLTVTSPTLPVTYATLTVTSTTLTVTSTTLAVTSTTLVTSTKSFSLLFSLLLEFRIRWTLFMLIQNLFIYRLLFESVLCP
jgi:hypothetical protein